MPLPGNQGNILIIDSDENVVNLLHDSLQAEGFNVTSCASATDVNLTSLVKIRLVIVDAMDQKFSGLDFIVAAKGNGMLRHTPIIMCAQPQYESIVADAINNGADDFIAKPFSLREMLSRIRALLRRYPVDTPSKTIRRNDIEVRRLGLSIDSFNRRITKGSDSISLTKIEFAILQFLIVNQNKFFTREQIYSEVWKNDSSSNSRIVDTNISRLRKKLGDTGKAIINRYGLGYAFSCD